jgi:GNAT superfamily N-acetyltransferase
MELVAVEALEPDRLAALETLYEDRFPGELRAPFEDLLRDQVVVLLDSDGQPGGFAVTRALGPTGWVFLRYFAVGARGKGVGSRLWVALCRRWADAGYSRVLLDVEDPDEPGEDADEVSIRRRRIGFYERLGVQLLPVTEYFPPHDDVPHRLRLMAAGTTGPLADADLTTMVLAVYEHRYGLPPTDPAVQHTLRSSGLTTNHTAT